MQSITKLMVSYFTFGLLVIGLFFKQIAFLLISGLELQLQCGHALTNSELLDRTFLSSARSLRDS